MLNYDSWTDPETGKALFPKGYKEPTNVATSLSEGVVHSYFSSVRPLLGTQLEMLGQTFGNPEMIRMGEKVSDFAVAQYMQRPELLPSGRAAKPLLEGGYKDSLAVSRTVGEMIPFMASVFGTSIVGGLVAGPPGAYAGAFSASAAAESAGAYREMVGRGISPDDAVVPSQAYGAIAAILENAIGYKPSSMVASALKGTAQKAAVNTVKKDFKTFLIKELPKYGKDLLKKTIEEGEEEAIQQLSQNLITKWQDESKPVWENVAESFAAGAIGSLGFLPASLLSKAKTSFDNRGSKNTGEPKEKGPDSAGPSAPPAPPSDPVDVMIAEAVNEVKGKLEEGVPGEKVVLELTKEMPVDTAKALVEQAQTELKEAEPTPVAPVEPTPAAPAATVAVEKTDKKVKTPVATTEVAQDTTGARSPLAEVADKMSELGAKILDKSAADLHGEFQDAQNKVEENLTEVRARIAALEEKAATVKGAARKEIRKEIDALNKEIEDANTKAQDEFLIQAGYIRSHTRQRVQKLWPEASEEQVSAIVEDLLDTVTDEQNAAALATRSLGEVADVITQQAKAQALGESSEEQGQAQEPSETAEKPKESEEQAETPKKKNGQEAIDKSTKSAKTKAYDKPSDGSGSENQPEDNAKPGENGGEEQGGAGGTATKPGESVGRDVGDGGREPGERSTTRLTNDEIDTVLSGITEIGADGEVKLTGPVTENIREAANQFKTGGVAKEGRGILDEYYTSSTIVDMVKSILNLPQKPLKVLEPSVGSGNFLYALPEGSQNTVYGMEVNPISAKIAKVFHENARIFNAPFESLFMDKNGKAVAFKADYDLVIGNPPYGDHRGLYKGLGEESGISRYEEYFIKRGLDLLKPGGKLVMVVPSSFIRSGENKAKVSIFGRGKLITAFRLPNGVFSGTTVGTDIVVFEKTKAGYAGEISPFVDDGFFIENPQNILGVSKKRKDRFGKMETFVDGSIDDAVSIFHSITSLQAMGLLEKTETPVTPVNVEIAQAAVEESGNQNADKLLKEATKKGKEIIDKKVKKTTSKKGAVVSLSTHYEGQFTDQEIAYWKATKSDGSIDTALIAEPDGKIVNSMGGKWYVDFNYLQGDIYEKLETLESEKGKIGKEQYARQKAKLEAVLPKRETASNIKIAPNSQFVATLEITDAEGEKVLLRQAFIDWMRQLPNGAFSRSSAWEVTAFIKNEQVRGNDKEMNEAIRTRRKVVADRLFSRFIREELSDESRKKFEDSYNRTFNFFYTPDFKKVPMFSDTHATFQGDTFKPTDTQKHGIGRLVNMGGGILAHEVGFGKTISGILSVHEMMTRGWVKKPVLVVPSDQLIKQWTHTLNELVPNAKVNVLGNLGAAFHGDLASLKIEDGSWTFLTYEGLERLSFKDETYDKLSSAFAYIGDDLTESRNKRDAEKAKARAEETSGKMRRGARGDLFFEDLGFDHLTMDEAHNANHIVSKVKLEKGQASEFNQFAQKTSNLGIKTWITAKFIQDGHEGRNVNLLTATPFTNHPLEYYSMLSLVADKALEQMGAYNVNEFFGMFMEAESQYEFKADGSYQKKTDVRKFRNFRQFRKLLDSFIDFKTDDPSLVRPERTQQNYEIPQNDFGRSLESQANALFQDKENAGTLRAIGELRKISFSPFASRFYQGAAPSYKQFVEESPKIKTLMALIGQNLKDKPEAGQIVYVDDIGVGFLPDMKQYLVKEMGLKADEVEIISGATPKAKRPDIQDRFNAGKVKVLLGSEAIKEGMNLQKNSTDLYILSLPWNFTQLRQVIGRLWRQGNQWKNVRINNLFIQDSIDVFLSQKLDNKQKRYEAALSSGENEVDVGDVDYQELKFQLVKDPAMRAKLELTAEVEQINQVLDQQKSELAFVTKKAGMTEALKDQVKNDEVYLAKTKEQLDKARPDEIEFYQGRLGRYQRELEKSQKALLDHQETLKARGLTDEVLAEKKVALEKEVADLDAKKKVSNEQFDQRVKEIAASMPVPVQFSDKIVSQFVADRAEQNKTFYQLREKESQTTIAPVETTKEIKNAAGTKVLETKKVVKVKRSTAKESKANKESAVLSDSNLSVSEKVDALLSVKQEGKDFKDIGERVAGSKKERAAIVTVMESGDQSLLDEMVLRLGVEAVADVINKDKILENTKKPDPAQDKLDGVPAIIAYVKKDIFNKIPKVFTPVKTGRGRYSVPHTAVYFSRSDEDKYRSGVLSMSGENKLIMAEAFARYPELLREFVGKLADVKSVPDLAAFWKWYGDTYMMNGGRQFDLADKKLLIGSAIFGFGMKNYEMPSFVGEFSRSPENFAEYAKSVLENPTYRDKTEAELATYRAKFNEFLNRQDWWDKAMGKREKKDGVTDTSHGNFVPMTDIRRTAQAIPAARVKAETLKTDLGFKSVQFGNYMDDVTSREHIRHTIGAIEDIGTALDLNVPKLINDLGLSIAYGARGGSKALAHFEPTKTIINLTKGKGDGSFFHEFFHFLDFTYPKKAGSYRKAWSSNKERYYRSDAVDPVSVRLLQTITGKYYRAVRELKPGFTDEYVQDEVKKLFAAGVSAEAAAKEAPEGAMKRRWLQDVADMYRVPVSGEVIIWNEDTQFVKDSAQVGGDYWTRPEELLARASQAYIEDKMAEKGMVNDYVTRSTIGHKAYPQGEERERFNKLFDELFAALREKYARTEGEAPKFKVSDEKPHQTMTEAAAVLEDYKNRLNIDFDVQFVDSILVGTDPAAFARMNGRVQGVTVDNTLVLLKEMASRTAEHEVVHLTLANLDRIEAFKSEGLTRDAVLQAKANQLGISLIGNERKVEESLAEDFEKYVDGKEQAGPVRRFFSTLKRLLLRFARAIGLTQGNIVRDYYDILHSGRSVDSEMVRLENKGIVDAFSEDGAFTIEDMETFGVAKFGTAKSDIAEFARQFPTALEWKLELAKEAVAATRLTDRIYTVPISMISEQTEHGASFAEGIKAKGIKPGRIVQSPITLFSTPTNLVAEDGNHRLLQAVANGETEITAVVVERGAPIPSELGNGMTTDEFWQAATDTPVFFKMEPTDSTKADKRLNELSEGFNETAAKLQETQQKMEAWFLALQQSAASKESSQAAVAETPEEIKRLAKFTKRTPPVGALTKRGQQEVVAQFADPKAAEEQLNDYLKRKTQLIEVRNRLRQLRKDIAQARKDKRASASSLRDLERRLRLRKKALERNDHYIDLGRIRGKKEGIQFVMKRKSAIYQIAGSIGIDNKKMRDLVGGRHIETMTEMDFNDYLIELSNKANIIRRTEEMREDLGEFIEANQLRNTDNLRLAMGLPSVSKMTLEQVTRFMEALSGYRLGDVFLSKRELETIHRTEWGDVKTAFELVGKLEQHMGVPKDQLAGLKDPGERSELMSWIALSRQHPFYKWLVEKRIAASIVAERESVELTDKLFVLANAARKSRAPLLSLKDRLVQTMVPTDNLVAGYIESQNKDAFATANKMTAEEIKFADKYIALMHQIYEHLKEEYATPERQNYMTHIRRTFLETLKEDGIKKAVGELFSGQIQDQAAFTILTGKTGEILAFEKFMGNLLPRTGVLTPSKNVARVASQYIRAFTKKKALDSFIPDVMLTLHAHQLAFGPGTTEKGVLKDTRIEDFVKSWLNDAKGRKIEVTLLKQGSKAEISLAAAVKFQRLLILGFNVVSGLVNIVGDMVSVTTALGPVKTLVAAKRTVLDFKQSRTFGKAQQAFTGKNPFIELVTDPTKNLPPKILDASMLLFGWTAYIADRFYLRGAATQQEFEKTVIEDKRLVEIARELAKWKASKFYIPSLLGSTTFGKAGTEFNTWAFPVFNAAVSNIQEYYKSFKDKKFDELKPNGSEHARDLTKLVVNIMVVGILVTLLGPPDDEDKSQWGKARRKAYQEMGTLGQALMSSMNVGNYFPVLRSYIRAAKIFGLAVTWEKYTTDGEGYAKGDLKWIKQAKELFTPSAIKQLMPPPEQMNSRNILLEEAAQTGDFDAEAIGSFLNPEKWEEQTEEAESYRQRTMAALTVEYNAIRKYPGSQVVDIIRTTTKNADRVADLLTLANEIGIDQVESQLRELREDAELYTNASTGTGALVSSNLYLKFQEAAAKYRAAE